MGSVFLVLVILLCFFESEHAVQAATSNQPPRFVNYQSTFFLGEDTAIGTTVGILEAEDIDNRGLVFSIKGQIAKSILELVPIVDDDLTDNREKISIVLKAKLDWETKRAYEDIVFQVSDQENDQIERGAQLYVLDTNDNAPTFVGLPYRAEVREDAKLGLSIFRVTATDPDDGISRLVSFNITTRQGLFAVDASKGNVSVQGTLDYETEKFYQLEIMAVDGGGLNTTTDLVVNVIDVQDTAPFFLNLPYMANIYENATVGTSIVQVTALDGDRGVPNPITYTLIAGSTDLFEIDGDGVISIKSSLDREDPAVADLSGVVKVTVEASEVTLTPQGPTTATAEVTITILDINDRTPSFSAATYNAVVMENTQNRIPVSMVPDGMEIMVTDEDQGNLGRFKLFLEKDGQPFDIFEVNPDKVLNEAPILLRVSNTSALDYEHTQEFTFQIVAQEYLTVERHESRADVIVQVQDVNDNFPMFTEESYEIMIPENSPRDTSVVTVSARDDDSGSNGDITFLIRGASADMFSIDEKTGEIRVAVDADQDHSLLNRETMDRHYLTVEAVDGGGLRASVQLIITLEDVNDNAPTIARVRYDGYLTENQMAFDRPVIIQASDLDLSPNNNISFEIVGGDHSDQFQIDSSSGEVTPASPLDYESLVPELSGQLEITVRAKDAGNPPQLSTVILGISVEDENDEVPSFAHSLYTATVAENTPSGTNITFVSATDNDGTAPNNDVIYRIESGARDKFRIDAVIGIITVESGADLDRDVYGSSYSLAVLAIDRGTPPNTGYTTVQITVTDINNKMPEFDPISHTVAILENSEVGSSVYTYTATDADQDAVLQYSLVQDLIKAEDENKIPVQDKAYLQSLFDIYSNNGSVFVKGELNREQVEEVTLTILVTDLNALDPPTQTATAQLTVVLQDVNDNPPSFIPSSMYFARISEASQAGIEVKQVLAIDKDKNSDLIAYYLEQTSLQAESFEISDWNRNTGVVTLRSPVNREEYHQINLTVRAEDYGDPPLTAYASILVTIEDVNDNSPQWTVFNSRVVVYENATDGTSVSTVSATDGDTGDYGRVMYYITSGDFGKFAINPESGVITVIGSLNREETDEYVLTIEARDNNEAPPGEQRTSPGYMTIDVGDVNDVAPMFEKPSYATDDTGIQESAEKSTPILTVRARDDDAGVNGEVVYMVDRTAGNASGLFDVGRVSGLVTVNQTLRGHVGWYYIVVTAQDKGTPTMSNSTNVYVLIKDVNDHKPQIYHPPANLSLYIPENIARGHWVSQVRAKDQDAGTNGEVRYEFVKNEINEQKDWLKFNIDNVSGNITTAAAIDREQQEIFYVEVRAYDLGSPSYDDRRTIRIVALDEDDNPPVFTRTPETTPYKLSVVEERADILVGHVNIASDPDTGNNSLICYYLIGGSEQYRSKFYLNKTVGALYLREPLDREKVDTVDLVVKASEDCWSGRWELTENSNTEYNATEVSMLWVQISVQDINDNQPRFTKKWFTAGVTRDTQFGEPVMDLSEYVVDGDSPGNQIAQYYLIKPMRITDTLKQALEGVDPFLLDKQDGVLFTNVYFQENMKGYFEFSVVVNDSIPGHTDTAEVSIYLLNEDQRAKVVIRGDTQEVGSFKDPFAQFLTNITGFVINVDKIQTHEDSTGKPDERKSDMFIHAIDPKSGEVLDAKLLINLIDKNYESLDLLFKKYNVINIVPAVESTSTDPVEENLQMALILVAALLLVILVIVCAVALTCRKKYKRKLKAATAMAFGTSGTNLNHMEVPGTNLHSYEGSNPIWLEQYENGWPRDSDTDSKCGNSLDENAIEATLAKSYDEQEMTVDMYNDEFDHFNKLPGSKANKQNGDIYLKAALTHHESVKQKRNSGNMNGSRHSLKKNGHIISPPAYENLAFQKELTMNNSTFDTLESLQTTDI